MRDTHSDNVARAVMKVAKLSGDLGIRTLDLQADIGELATRVTQQACTIEAISSAAAQLSQDGERVSLAGQDAREKAIAARSIIDDSGRQLSIPAMIVFVTGRVWVRDIFVKTLALIFCWQV